jgi:hypothetical protein
LELKQEPSRVWIRPLPGEITFDGGTPLKENQNKNRKDHFDWANRDETGIGYSESQIWPLKHFCEPFPYTVALNYRGTFLALTPVLDLVGEYEIQI